MTRLDILRKNYLRICGQEWPHNVAGSQRVWLAVYDKDDERKLRHRLKSFEEATQEANHRWQTLDLTDAFANWMCGPDNGPFAERYFEAPELLDDAILADFKQSIVAKTVATLIQLPHSEDTVLAVYGIGGLFGFIMLSEILPLVDSHVRGRLLVFFPGSYEADVYHMLDARDGWNYLAVPITASDAEPRR